MLALEARGSQFESEEGHHKFVTGNHSRKLDEMKDTMYSVVKLPAVVGWKSLVGVGKIRPCVWGNYFSLHGKDARTSPRVVNMWAENMTHLVDTGVLEDGMIEGKLFSYTDRHWFVVTDPRVPLEYLYNKFNFTGYYRPPLEIAMEMYAHYGDPTNELEQWTDPVSYYGKRGAEYNPDKGLVITYCEGHPKYIELKAKYAKKE